MSHRGFIVPPTSTAKIMETAGVVRRAFAPFTSPTGYLNVAAALEWMPKMLPGFEFEVVEARLMGSDHGRTWPDKKLIHIREDVYDGMCQGNGRDRFTVTHEFGHLFLHPGIAFARAMTETTKIYCSSEWQADTFASHLLIDSTNLQQSISVAEVARRFGVSPAAAAVRFKK